MGFSRQEYWSDPTEVGNLISVSFAFAKSSLNIWKFLVHILLKPGLENFEHLLVCNISHSSKIIIIIIIDISNDPR